MQSLPLRKTGTRLGIDKDTAFRWRHRLLRALSRNVTQPLGQRIVIGETWFPYSVKGRPPTDRLPRRRAAYRRADVTPVWVAVALDAAGTPASGVVGLRRPTGRDLGASLGSRLNSHSVIVSTEGRYGAPARLAALKNLEYRRVVPVSGEIGALRRYILALRRWMRRFRGVATRYLSHYLAWHAFLTVASELPAPLAARFLVGLSSAHATELL